MMPDDILIKVAKICQNKLKVSFHPEQIGTIHVSKNTLLYILGKGLPNFGKLLHYLMNTFCAN